eukprot:Pgem_evm1s1971
MNSIFKTFVGFGAIASNPINAYGLTRNGRSLENAPTCSYEINIAYAPSDVDLRGLYQCELLGGPLNENVNNTDEGLNFAIFYAGYGQNPGYNGCNTSIFYSYDDDDNMASVSNQIEQQVPIKTPVLSLNGPKLMLWNSQYDLNKYPVCVDYLSSPDSSDDDDNEEPFGYDFQIDVGTGNMNWTWQNNLTMDSALAPFEKNFVNPYPPKVFDVVSGLKRAFITTDDGTLYTIQTVYVKENSGVTIDNYLNYIGTGPGQCCESLPEGWTVSIEESTTALCGGCCTCYNHVVTDDLKWTWAK